MKITGLQFVLEACVKHQTGLNYLVETGEKTGLHLISHAEPPSYRPAHKPVSISSQTGLQSTFCSSDILSKEIYIYMQFIFGMIPWVISLQEWCLGVRESIVWVTTTIPHGVSFSFFQVHILFFQRKLNSPISVGGLL